MLWTDLRFVSEHCYARLGLCTSHSLSLPLFFPHICMLYRWRAGLLRFFLFVYVGVWVHVRVRWVIYYMLFLWSERFFSVSVLFLRCSALFFYGIWKYDARCDGEIWRGASLKLFSAAGGYSFTLRNAWNVRACIWNEVCARNASDYVFVNADNCCSSDGICRKVELCTIQKCVQLILLVNFLRKVI